MVQVDQPLSVVAMNLTGHHPVVKLETVGWTRSWTTPTSRPFIHIIRNMKLNSTFNVRSRWWVSNPSTIEK